MDEYVVFAMLDNAELNGLARKYLECDFQSEKASFTEAVRSHKKIHSSTKSAMQQNRAIYEAKIRKINDHVYQRNEEAERALQQADTQIATKISQFEKEESQLCNPAKRRLLRSKIDTYEIMRKQSQANLMHMKATVAETDARKKANMAQDTMNAANQQVLSDAMHEGDILNLSEAYKQDTVHQLQMAILGKKDLFRSRIDQAEKILRYIQNQTDNLDLLTNEELEEQRQKLAAELTREFENIISD